MPFSTIFDKRTNERGWSGAIFKDVPAEEYAGPNKAGWFWDDDFLQGVTVDSDATLVTNKGVYTITQATAGSVSMVSAGNIGTLVIDSGSTTSGQGLNIQGGPLVTPAAGLLIGMEWRLKFETISTPPQVLLGLSDNATAAVTGGATVVVNTTNVTDAIALTNIVSNAPGLPLFPYHDEAGESAVQGTTALHTIVASEYFKVGCRVEGLDRVLWYANGEHVLTHTPGSSSGTIPTVALQPIIVVQTDGTVQPVCHLDGLALGCSY